MARIFFSYSHLDEALRDRLEKGLAMLLNEGLIEPWHDRRIIVVGAYGAVAYPADSDASGSLRLRLASLKQPFF